MDKWNDFIDAIYVISLPCATERRTHVVEQLTRFGINNYSIWPAIENSENPAKGLSDTIKAICRNSLDNGYSEVLIFEDDFLFMQDPEETMDEAIKQLPHDYLQLYLGVNPASGGFLKYSSNLHKVVTGLSAHAVIYSSDCMEMITKFTSELPIDVLYARDIHILGRSFATAPMLCAQRPGYSYIEKREVNYKPFLEDRYNEAVKNMNHVS